MVHFHLLEAPTVSTALSEGSECRYFPVLDLQGVFVRPSSQEVHGSSPEGGALEVQRYRGSISFGYSYTHRRSVPG